ncbi:MAG: amidohydrolase [Clostridiales Family XIII bacterium]|jgi:5-methylthioadenosine/S-adenosylhomocysteine deaminase|nr:amidohydrolase [Clostridiales Family XIII bacterium]
MLFKNIAVLRGDFSIARGLDVRVEGPKIASVAAAALAPGGGEPGCEAVDGAGLLLMPAFYNAHTHMPMTLLRGYGENMRLQDWLGERVFPFEDKLTAGDCYHASALQCAEGFMHGVVSHTDQYFFCDDIVRAVAESGAKINIARGMSFFDELLDTETYSAFQEAKSLFDGSNGSHDGRIRVELSLHAEYTATKSLIAAVADLVHETGAPLHTHISETQDEHEQCKLRHGGKTPTQVFAEAGVFDNGGVAAHCVWATEEDAGILAEKGVSAASCPVSNMKLASGVMDAAMLYGKGVNIALGTDGAASNNSLNFFEEVKAYALLQKVRFSDPTRITPAQALYAATRGGALAQGRADCGVVEEGMRADLIAIDLTSPALTPMYDPAAALVYAASSRDIALTVSDGRVVYRRSGAADAAGGAFPTVDLERTLFEVNRAKERILGQLAEDA